MLKLDNNFKKDISRSLMTMITVNTLLFAKSIAQIEQIKNVVFVGTHIDVLPYQQMAQHWFDDVQQTVEGSIKA